MDKRLQAYLDGELERSALPADLQEDADRWGELDALAAEMRTEQAPPWLETSIMANLPAQEVLRPWWHRGVIWLFAPQQVAVRPAALAFGGLAALFAFLLVSRPDAPSPVLLPVGTTHTISAAAAPVIYVQFAFADPAAQSVTVAGDFNDWDPEATALRDSDGDGIWTGLIALRPGMHKYMFVVDGEKWVTDPEAERYVDDGFGMRNAVIAVTPPGRSI
jgi:hypothetical protein